MWRWDGMQFTWIAGTNVKNQAKVLLDGEIGKFSVMNSFDGRYRHQAWKLAEDMVVIFGGGSSTPYNDVWAFRISTSEFALIGLPDSATTASYPTVTGTGSLSAFPGSSV